MGKTLPKQQGREIIVNPRPAELYASQDAVVNNDVTNLSYVVTTAEMAHRMFQQKVRPKFIVCLNEDTGQFRTCQHSVDVDEFYRLPHEVYCMRKMCSYNDQTQRRRSTRDANGNNLGWEWWMVDYGAYLPADKYEFVKSLCTEATTIKQGNLTIPGPDIIHEALFKLKGT